MVDGPLLGGRKQVLGQLPFRLSLAIKFRCRIGTGRRYRNGSEVSCQHIYHRFVRCHYDGSVWNLPDQLGTEATVETFCALLCPYSAQSLPERAIFRTFFS